MNHSKKIIAMLLLAICLMGILPITVYANNELEVGKTYYFNNDGNRSTYQSLFDGQYQLHNVFDQIVELDVDVVGTQIQITYEDDVDNDGLDIGMVLFGSGFVPLDNGIPLYYSNIAVVITTDIYSTEPKLTSVVITIADLSVEDEPSYIYSEILDIESFNIQIMDINYEDSVNLSDFASWFSEDREPWENNVDDILEGWEYMVLVFVSSVVEVYSNLNILSVVAIIIMAVSVSLCIVLIIKRLFERR